MDAGGQRGSGPPRGPRQVTGRGGCEGLEMGQSVTLAVPRRRREKGAGACWGLEGEEVKQLGSRGPGNTCPPGGRKGRVRGAAGRRRRLLPRQWCGALSKDPAFLLRLLSRPSGQRPQKLRLGQGCLLGPPEHLSPGISRAVSRGYLPPRSVCPTWAGHRDLRLEARASSLPCLTPRWPGRQPSGASLRCCWERGRGPQSRGHTGMGSRVGSSRSEAGVVGGLLGCSLSFPHKLLPGLAHGQSLLFADIVSKK